MAPDIWYAARGAGLSALVLLSVSTALGALVSHHGRASTRYVVQYLHRVTALLGLTALSLHLGAILADSYAKVGWLHALLPFAAQYRPTWVGLGTIAAYTFVGVGLLGLARGQMAGTVRGARSWRGLHALAYAGWAAAVLHGVNSGSDTALGWVRLIYVLCLLGVLGSVAYRIAAVRSTSGPTGADRFAHIGQPIDPRRTTAPVRVPSGASR
ncbi:MAG TPA: hypothetical protein VGN18_14595 [Jatrophihabitans sp.]|jgi:predicted ferric reductase|uniref:hypothetical protein n=1 Tax=Jatrophihabitans sp. TaxID=1932789 RepID=UPI002DFBCE6B|nr:hypothetical protein [Jatrophihabitans sp.]